MISAASELRTAGPISAACVPELLLLWLVPEPLPNAPSKPVSRRDEGVGVGALRLAREDGVGVERGVGVRADAREVGVGVGAGRRVARLVGAGEGVRVGRAAGVGVGNGAGVKLSGTLAGGVSGRFELEGGAIAASGTGSGAVEVRPTSVDRVTTTGFGLISGTGTGCSRVIRTHASATWATAATPRPIRSSRVMRANAMINRLWLDR
ncbi:hypothetical protein QQS45_08875 [Alteriqipengyuania flavescens]|uniref:hypothetical protein n=1 Tax=Alteriqipengyuania flavescens TaxID=3053610 RepID=UPI0025B3AE14|nr:hypothetical protein [Alteriqipengyuania flavescens]WJY17754.1 hypothetical protein QQW98_08870 [Alteriqipengyuania flavescens]WJY23696.1 hypothetical protein QQS45_08875 [Alteriqipengyuania flavescens]